MGRCPSESRPVMPTPAGGTTRSTAAASRDPERPQPRLAARDAAAEAVAGIVQRPGRAVLTMIGTILGVGAFVAVLGLTATGAGQISHQFTVLEDTTVTAQDNGPAHHTAPPTNPPPPTKTPATASPADADQIAGHIKGVTAAGVWWPVSLPQNA